MFGEVHNMITLDLIRTSLNMDELKFILLYAYVGIGQPD